MNSVIPGACVIPITHTRNRTESLRAPTRSQRSQAFVEELLKVSRQLTLKHVQLMQRKMRLREVSSGGFRGSRHKSHVDESCSAMCDDPFFKERTLAEVQEDRGFDFPSRSVTPAVYLLSRPNRAAGSGQTPSLQPRALRKLQPIVPSLAQKAREASRILAPLSRAVYPCKFASSRRRVSPQRFTLEDFFILEHARNPSSLLEFA